MAGMRKSGKGRSAKGDGKKTTVGARPAKPRRMAFTTDGNTFQQDRWRTMIETSAAWIWETDADIRHTYTNAFVTRCLGYEPTEFLSLDTLDLIHPDDRGLVKRLVQNAITRKEGWFDQVLRWRHKDGSWKYIESSGSALVDEQGSFAGLYGVDRDITEQKRAVENLRRSEEKYRDLFENAIDAICIIDRDQNYLDVNRRAIELFGYSREEFLSMNVRDMLPPGQIARSEKEFAKLTESGAYEKFTGQARKKDGSYIDIEVSSSAIVEQGQVIGSRDIIRDITERRTAEALLRDSESRMRSIVESIPVGMHMYRLEPDGRLIFTGANPAADRILGVDNRIFIGKTIEEAFPPLKKTEVPQRYRDVARSGNSWQTENIEYQNSAIKGAFEVHAFQTAPNTVVAAFEDITARKRAEEALRTSESRYRAIVDSQTEFVVRYLPGGILTFVNDTLCRYIGMRREDLLGRSYYPFMHPDDREGFIRKIEALDRDNPVMVAEARVVLPDGRVTWHQWTHDAIFGERGDAVEYQSTGRDVTELKKAAERLRESEEKFSKIYRKAPLLITLSDIETGRFLDVNEKFLEISGFTREEVVGRTAIEIGWISEEQRARMQQILRERGRVSGMELSLRRKDKGEVICLYNGEVITVGGTQRLLSIAQDITERKAAEVALQKSETMLQTIIDAEPDCIKVLDENACLIMMNRAGLDMLQVDSLDQVRGQCICPMISFECRPAFMELTRRVFQGESGTLFFEMVGTQGRRLCLETHAVPLRNEKGEITALLGVTRDVTERKRAEEELREKEQKYRLLFESANDGIFIQDETGFTDCNQKGAEMYGLPKAEIIGRSPREFAPERQPDGRLSAEVAGEKIRAALSGVPQMFEWQPLRADGSAFDVEITLNRLELGGKICLQAIVRDISERKRLEQEHIRSQKLESIGTLAGGIAHDFNNLLQGVFGYISMAKLTHDQKDKSLSMLDQAEKALHQSVSLTSQLLTFSKGGKPLKKKIDLKPVIENAVKFALSGSRVDYALSFDDDLRPVKADEGQLGQVVQNIILNAEQAMPLGGRIEIAARNVLASSLAGVPAASSADLVEITVRDQGIGIPPEHLPKIFDPYFTTKEKGSGLGLATTYSIVKNHGGDINVSSVLGKGTTFTVYFPAAGQDVVGPASTAGPRTARTAQVLVMDDEELVRRVAHELLTGLGHDVELAAHGGEAVEKYLQAKAEGRPFDVVILDLTIRGGMGGDETMRKLLEIDPGVKAIVSSGYSNDNVVANYRDHGFAAFLKKPYDLTDLQATLNALLR